MNWLDKLGWSVASMESITKDKNWQWVWERLYREQVK